MGILRDGTFDFDIPAEALNKGLRPSKRNPRNQHFLVECVGAVGLDGVLQVIEDLETDRIDTSVITDGFPYPQIFILTNTIIVCGETDIYEWDGSSLTHMLGPVAAGELWSLVDFFGFVYMSNRVVAVERDSNTGIYSTVTDQPVANALCNFNGQVFVGSPIETPLE